MREIWEMQLRLPKTRSRKAAELTQHPRFRAAYDFLLLRQQSGEDLQELCDFWTEIQKDHPPAASRSHDRRSDGAAERNDGQRRRRPRRRRNGNNNRS